MLSGQRERRRMRETLRATKEAADAVRKLPSNVQSSVSKTVSEAKGAADETKRVTTAAYSNPPSAVHSKVDETKKVTGRLRRRGRAGTRPSPPQASQGRATSPSPSHSAGPWKVTLGGPGEARGVAPKQLNELIEVIPEIVVLLVRKKRWAKVVTQNRVRASSLPLGFVCEHVRRSCVRREAKLARMPV